MLTEDDARKIGLRACVEKIGLEFCKKHKDTAICAHGVIEEVMQCYYGIDDQPAPDYANLKPEELCLNSAKYAPYFARCEVSMKDGTITFLEFCIPKE
ncbi:MAG: hypothetical protein J6K04_03140 [Lachnospiraceae bacterium]|nr:hypothetical protein [Lachnospiraceae bacterium]